MTPEVKGDTYGIARIIFFLYTTGILLFMAIDVLYPLTLFPVFAGFTAGTTCSIFNFYLLENGVRRMLGGGSKRTIRRGYLMFLERFALIIAVITYSVRHPYYLNVFSLTMGLVIIQMALFISALKTNLNICNK